MRGCGSTFAMGAVCTIPVSNGSQMENAVSRASLCTSIAPPWRFTVS